MRNWDLREFRVRVNLPSPIQQVGVPILHLIPPIRGLPNPIRHISEKHFRPGGMAPSERTRSIRAVRDTPASRPRVVSHIALQSPFHRFFSLCRSPILNKHSGVVANCDHTSEWVHWVHACIGIAMQWVTLRKSLLAFLLH